MSQTRVMLNVAKPSNSSFFDPVGRLHLTRENPIGILRVLSPQVLLELRAFPMPGLIDLDNKVDIEKGIWKPEPNEQIRNMGKEEPAKNQEPKEENVEIVNEVDLSGEDQIIEPPVVIPPVTKETEGEEAPAVTEDEEKATATEDENTEEVSKSKQKGKKKDNTSTKGKTAASKKK